MEIVAQDPNLALQEFNTKIDQIENDKKKPSNASIIFWLCIFPPVAVYKMWKNSRFHVWFPNLMIISALLNIPSLATINTPLPDIGIKYTPLDTTPYFISIIIISVVEIILGIYLRKKAQKEGSLTGTFILISLFLMTVQYVPFLVMTTNTISSVLSTMPTTNPDQFEF